MMRSSNKNIIHAPEHPVLLFDGVCNVCNGFVQFVIARDRKRVFRYASLQSEFATTLLQKMNLPSTGLDTVILIDEKGSYFAKSDVALELFRRFGGFWSLLYYAKVIPKPIRDGVYDFIARNRYRFFGKKDSCMIPTPELRALFYS